MIVVVADEGVLDNGHATEDSNRTSQCKHVAAVLVELTKVVHYVVEVDGHGELWWWCWRRGKCNNLFYRSVCYDQLLNRFKVMHSFVAIQFKYSVRSIGLLFNWVLLYTVVNYQTLITYDTALGIC